MSDNSELDRLAIHRRRFLIHSMTITGGAAAGLGMVVALKTDALARSEFQAYRVIENGMGGMPYPYMNP